MSLDLRALDPGHTVELDTPSAAFTIDRPGYYRVDVAPDRTSFVTRARRRRDDDPGRGRGGLHRRRASRSS